MLRCSMHGNAPRPMGCPIGRVLLPSSHDVATTSTRTTRCAPPSQSTSADPHAIILFAAALPKFARQEERNPGQAHALGGKRSPDISEKASTSR
jgi:hypothetical protein